MTEEAAIARAARQRQKAYALEKANKPAKEVTDAFSEAARAFQPLAESGSAARQPQLYMTTAQLYEKAGFERKAAYCYERAGDVSTAARRHCEAERFDDVLRLLRAHAPPSMSWLTALGPHSVISSQVLHLETAVDLLDVLRRRAAEAGKPEAVKELFPSDDGTSKRCQQATCTKLMS